MEQELLAFIKDNYKKKYGSLDTFEENYKLYLSIPSFKASENFHEVFAVFKDKKHVSDVESEYIEKKDSPKDKIHYENYLNCEKELKPEIHWIMRSVAQFYMIKVFDALKIDQKDPNIAINALGKGTPGRIVKMWSGANPEDTSELLSGRWNKEPALSVFPNDGSTTGGEIINAPIIKEVDVVAVCSHHFLPFSTLEPNAKAIITYIPKKHLIGISKLQRFTKWASARGWLQEDLTSYLGETIKRISGSEDVKIELVNLVHGCEKFRGAYSKNGNLTTYYKSGIFKKEEK